MNWIQYYRESCTTTQGYKRTNTFEIKTKEEEKTQIVCLSMFLVFHRIFSYCRFIQRLALLSQALCHLNIITNSVFGWNRRGLFFLVDLWATEKFHRHTIHKLQSTLRREKKWYLIHSFFLFICRFFVSCVISFLLKLLRRFFFKLLYAFNENLKIAYVEHLIDIINQKLLRVKK